MENKEAFNFTYSAKEQNEIKSIRQKYTAPDETEGKLERLRRLDASVTKKPSTVALILGVIGTLIMGIGMSLVMTDIGIALLGTVLSMILGICVGIAGMILVCLAYPVYNVILRRERKRTAPEIIRLTDELLK